MFLDFLKPFLGFLFFFSVIIRAKNKENLPFFIKLLKRALLLPSFSLWFLQQLAKGKLLEEFLVQAESKEVRYGICGLIKTAIRTQKVTQETLEEVMDGLLRVWAKTKEHNETIFYIIYHICLSSKASREILIRRDFFRKAGFWVARGEQPDFGERVREGGEGGKGGVEDSELGEVNERGRKKKVFKERSK